MTRGKTLLGWMAAQDRSPAHLADKAGLGADRLVALIAGEVIPSEEDVAVLAAATGIPGHELRADLSDSPGASWREVDPLHCYKPAEAAAILGIGIDTVRYELKAGKIEYHVLGEKAVRITRAALERRLTAQERKANADERAARTEAPRSDPPPEPGRLF